MKKIVFSLLFCLLTLGAWGENYYQVSYTYDKNGNRISRTAEMKFKSSKVAKDSLDDKNAIDFWESNDANVTYRIYPNPTKGVLRFDVSPMPLPEQKAYYWITDFKGATIINRKPCSATEVIDISQYVSGVYILSYQIEDKILHWKIVKE